MTEFMADSQNPIHESEVIPVPITAKAWGERYEGVLIVYYVDNESARMAHGQRKRRDRVRCMHDFRLRHDRIAVATQILA